MCLIVRGRVSDLLKLDLKSAQRCNADGWGAHMGTKSPAYSFRLKDKCIVNYLSRCNQSRIATVHFRFATHGDVNLANCHPFDLGDGSWLMHNGVLYGDHFQHDKKSDTAMLAEILKECGPKARACLLEALADSEYGNRFCILRGEAWQKFGDWHFDKATNTWHSNRSIIGGDKKSYIPTGFLRDEIDDVPCVAKYGYNYNLGDYLTEWE